MAPRDLQTPEARESKVRLDPRRRRPLQPDRPGRRPQLQLLRQHHDQKRQLLPMRQLRQHQRLQLNSVRIGTGASPVPIFWFVIPTERVSCATEESAVRGVDEGSRFAGRFWEGHGFSRAFFHVTAEIFLRPTTPISSFKEETPTIHCAKSSSDNPVEERPFRAALWAKKKNRL